MRLPSASHCHEVPWLSYFVTVGSGAPIFRSQSGLSGRTPLQDGRVSFWCVLADLPGPDARIGKDMDPLLVMVKCHRAAPGVILRLAGPA